MGHHGCSVNWEALQLPQLHDDGMDIPFSEEEVWRTINLSSADTAPGPDGFSGIFFRTYWSIIMGDVLRALHQFYNLHSDHFQQLNSAMVALIPKNTDPSEIGHFHPLV